MYMRRWKYLVAFLLLIPGIVSTLRAETSASLSKTPPNFKVAFIGDQGLGENAEAVLKLVRSEGAQAVLHQGDFDYENNPDAWNAQINEILGEDFPYFASVGNHDVEKWNGKDGYQQYLKNRLNRLGVEWDGDYGVKSSLQYKGIFIIQVSPGDLGSFHADYLREQLAKNRSIWRICCWHKNMRLMQVSKKTDDTGWDVYEEARKGGAIIATAHDHSYGRTHLMDSFEYQTVASQSNTLVITEGRTFAFFSGLGGKSIYGQELSGTWWAKIYTKTQDAHYGALFGVFNVGGVPNAATFYFKNIKGEVVDRFDVISRVHTGSAVEQHRSSR
ncbi:MAG: hypothetical protein HBSAPP01_20770 [Candidatus Brocadia sapporoensis]|nr:MAG: hypothetical protein HBSAPP01_20770 [Candidatus Brocadia sapporoensis]